MATKRIPYNALLFDSQQRKQMNFGQQKERIFVLCFPSEVKDIVSSLKYLGLWFGASIPSAISFG